MRKIFNKKVIKELRNFSVEIIKNISENIGILDDNYGADRNVDNDLGGYVLIAENIVDIDILKSKILNGVIPEYTDIIECSGGVNWSSSLFLISSDYAVVVVTTEELSKFLVE